MEDVNQALDEYYQKWDELIAGRSNKDFFMDFKAVAVGWKVADYDEYQKLLQLWQSMADQVVQTWMNGRWIAKLHLKDASLPGGVEIIKIMQRRPGSDDKLGLDHVDFYSPKAADAEAVLGNESGLRWSHENNDVIEGYEWISLWFSETEAKIKSDTVLDIVIAELRILNEHIKEVAS